jgi:hypothetical protein
MQVFHSGSDQSWIGYSEMGVLTVAGKFCKHKAVSAMSVAFSTASSMFTPIDQRKSVSTVSNHKARLSYHLRAIIVLMWANAILTATTWLVIFKAH